MNKDPYTLDEIARIVARGDMAAIDAGRAVATFADYLELATGDDDDRRSLDFVDDVPEAFLPLDLADRILAGESPVKIWRVHRDMTQAEFAKAAGISQSYLNEIERGHKDGSVESLRAIAQALAVDVGDLVN